MDSPILPYLNLSSSISSGITQAYLKGVMLFPDSPDMQQEVVANFHYANLITDAKKERSQFLFDFETLEEILNTLPDEVIEERALDAHKKGQVAGTIVWRAMADLNDNITPNKGQYGRDIANALQSRDPEEHFRVSKSTIDNTIWPRFEPVAHLWCAHGLFFEDQTDLPCPTDKTPEFLKRAEEIRVIGESVRLKNSKHTLLRQTVTLRVPESISLSEL
jgi:hypothetical protein